MQYSENLTKEKIAKQATLPGSNKTAMEIKISAPSISEINYSRVADSKIYVFKVNFQDYDFRYTKNDIFPERVFESYHVSENEDEPSHILLTLPRFGKSRQDRAILQEVGEKIKRITSAVELLPSTLTQQDSRAKIILRENIDHKYMSNLLESKFYGLFEKVKSDYIFYSPVTPQELNLSKYPSYKTQIF